MTHFFPPAPHPVHQISNCISKQHFTLFRYYNIKQRKLSQPSECNLFGIYTGAWCVMTLSQAVCECLINALMTIYFAKSQYFFYYLFQATPSAGEPV